MVAVVVADLVGLDLRTDIAVIKVDAGGLHPAKRGDSATVEQGDMVYAFGSPFDFRFSMSAGIVSGIGRTAGLSSIDYENFIQVDAAINPGNSPKTTSPAMAAQTTTVYLSGESSEMSAFR